MNKKIKKERVLIVEDSDLVVQILFEILSPYFEIDWVLDGVDALNKLERGKKYDLIITNQIMPRMDGIEFIRKVREKFPSIPMVVFTDDGYGNGPVRAGANLFITKPFQVLPFIRAVRQLLGYNDTDEELINKIVHHDR